MSDSKMDQVIEDLKESADKVEGGRSLLLNLLRFLMVFSSFSPANKAAVEKLIEELSG